MSNLHESLIQGEAALSVVGLGYVGLPIALAFAEHLDVIGFDINAERVAMMKEGIDPSGEIEPDQFQNKRIAFTHDAKDLARAKFHVVAVPTPIHASHQPDLTPCWLPPKRSDKR